MRRRGRPAPRVRTRLRCRSHRAFSGFRGRDWPSLPLHEPNAFTAGAGPERASASAVGQPAAGPESLRPLAKSDPLEHPHVFRLLGHSEPSLEEEAVYTKV